MSSAMKEALRKRPKVPWEAYERHVKRMLESTGNRVTIHVREKTTLKASDAEYDEYEVDAYADVEIFDGALIKVLIECKHHSQPVKRSVVSELNDKKNDLNFHKAMLFSTAGFQRGAVVYAERRGISLVKLAGSEFTYVVRDVGVGATYVVREPTTHYMGLESSPNPKAPESSPVANVDLVSILRPAPNRFVVVGPNNPHVLREWLLAPTPAPSDAEPEDDPTPEMDAPESGNDAGPPT